MAALSKAGEPDKKHQPFFIEHSRPKIMVVDDDPIINSVLARALNCGGFDVAVFTCPAEALRAFDSMAPDVAVVDWIMPDLDGLTMIDALRDKRPDLPALLITSYSDHETVRQAQATGRISEVLTKPFDLQNFLRSVSSFLPQAIFPQQQSWLDPAASSGRLIYYSPATHRWPGQEEPAPAAAFRPDFEKLLENVLDAIILVNKDGEIIYHNQGAARMFGFGRGKVLELREICPEDSWLPINLTHFFKPHPPVDEQAEGFFRRTDGADFYSIYSTSLFAQDGSNPALVLTIKDINDRYLNQKNVSEQARALERLAITDPLTGIYNRRHFDRRLEEEYKRAARYGSPFSLIMMDFDHFKTINDTYGHLIGDKVLINAGKELTRCLRDMDILARWGGEEFMILLPQTGAQTGISAAARLHRIISGFEKWGELAAGLSVTVSMGLVSMPWSSAECSLDIMLKKLDEALYKAKESGRNCIVRYDEHFDILIRV